MARNHKCDTDASAQKHHEAIHPAAKVEAPPTPAVKYTTQGIPTGGNAAAGAASPAATAAPSNANTHGSAAPAAAESLTPARVYLRSGNIPPAGVGAYGIVAMSSTSTPANRQRLLAVCASFVAHLPRQDALPGSIAKSDQMLTIWPLDTPNAPQAKADDCNYAIDHYDLVGGISAIQDARRQLGGVKLDGVGPFLIGWSPSNTRGVPDAVVLVIDLSAYDSQDSFDHEFLYWQKEIVENPTLWRDGFSLANLRLTIRDFSDRYGGELVKILNIGE